MEGVGERGRFLQTEAENRPVHQRLSYAARPQ